MNLADHLLATRGGEYDLMGIASRPAPTCAISPWCCAGCDGGAARPVKEGATLRCVARAGIEPVVIMPPTPEQMADIKRHFN
jgi:hypothetical protein